MYIQKRKKNGFSSWPNNQKSRRQLNLEPGMVGFLCTSNMHEKDCIRDAYKILNEFADEIYGQQCPEKSESKEKEDEQMDEPNDDNDGNDDEDISTALNKEINELKAVYSKPVRRFKVINTGIKNVTFIKSTLPEPLELVTKIVTELDRTKKQCTRFLLRLLPIEVVCKAYMNNIKKVADPLFDKYFAKTPKTFSIVFNHHWNNNISRSDVIEELSRMILQKNSGNAANLKNPDIVVIVKLIRGVCLLSIAPHYYKYRRYNLVEICNVKEQVKDEKETTEEEMKDSTTEADDTEETMEEQEEAIGTQGETVDKEKEAIHTEEQRINEQEEITDKQEEITNKKDEITDKQEETIDKQEEAIERQEETNDKQEKASQNSPEDLKTTEKEEQTKEDVDKVNELKNE